MSRPDLKLLLIEQGASREDAHLIVDLAEHCSIQMAEAMSRVVDTAPAELRATVMLLAARMMQATMSGFLEEASRELKQKGHL